MKRILLAGALALAAAGPALAADLPPPAPAPPPPRAPAAYVPTIVPAYSWTGFYLGLNGGYGFGTSNWTVATVGAGAPPPVVGATTGRFSPSGFLLGGQIGANYQVGAFVLGAEADLDWSTLKGNAAAGCALGAPASLTCQTAQSWLGTGRGRAGIAADRVLFFLTGGVAYGNEKLTPMPGFTDTITRVGWTGGAGVEVAFAQNWTAKVEYLYVNLGTGQCTTACIASTGAPPALTSANVTLTENLVRLGVNYKF